MCNCESDISSVNVSGITYNNQPKYSPTDCDYDNTILRNWYNMFDCIKKNSKHEEIGLTTAKVNSYIGYIQSALNYPDNFCFYKDVLDDILLNIIPRIINSVPECTNL